MHLSPFPLLQIVILLLTFVSCRGQSAETEDPNSTRPQQVDSPEQQPDNAHSQIRIMPGHIVMMVADLDRSQQFYEEHIGFHTTEEVVFEGLRRIFMSASDNHHELVLLESRVNEFPQVDHRQLQQVAFEVPTHEILVDYYNHIKQTDVPHTIMDNQVALSLYLTDPDGVTVEIYWDIRDQPFGEKMWRGNQITISEEKFLNPSEQLD